MFPSLCEAGGLSLISSGERLFSFLEIKQLVARMEEKESLIRSLCC